MRLTSACLYVCVCVCLCVCVFKLCVCASFTLNTSVPACVSFEDKVSPCEKILCIQKKCVRVCVCVSLCLSLPHLRQPEWIWKVKVQTVPSSSLHYFSNSHFSHVITETQSNPPPPPLPPSLPRPPPPSLSPPLSTCLSLCSSNWCSIRPPAVRSGPLHGARSQPITV